MTGKDFFGKLITNAAEESPPEDRERTSRLPQDAAREEASHANEGSDRRRPETVRYVDAPVSDLNGPASQQPPAHDGSIETTFDPEARFDLGASNDRSEHIETSPTQDPSGFDAPEPGGDGQSADPSTIEPTIRYVEQQQEWSDKSAPAGLNTSDGDVPDAAPAGPHVEPSGSRNPDASVASMAADTPAEPHTVELPAEPPSVELPVELHAAETQVEPQTAETSPEPQAVETLAEQIAVEGSPEPPETHDAGERNDGTMSFADIESQAAQFKEAAKRGEQNASGGLAGSDRGPRSKSGPPSGEAGDVRDRVVLRLVEKKIVSSDQVKKALQSRSKNDLKATLWRILAQDPTVDREQVYREAALTYAFEERDLGENDIDLAFVRQVADVFPEKKRNRLIELRIVPIGYEFEQQTQVLRVVFITHDPSLPAVRELMQDLNLERYELQYAPETKVKDLLARAFPKKNEFLERMSDDPLAYDLGATYEDEKSELIDEEALEAEINRSSLINLFEAALVEAVHRGASDIHIYPNAQRQIEFHFRVDGRLSLWHVEDKVHPESLLAVIKDNTMNVDRFEREMAQDGFIQRKIDDTLIRYRVSILPIATASNNLHAESIVIRVLDDRKVITDLSKLGLLEGALERFDMAIRQPHGMVILTGPTGSGKSTTLVASLHQVVTPAVNVLTVEDPVEYIIPGVRQIKLNHKLGLEGALRAILRHDPDVVMVGEMRDKPTAELAIKLANTGHLTFSTLHTNDAPSAVSRLYKMGVEPFLIAYAINLVVAQRLLRTLCPDCKVVDNDPDPVLLDRLGFTEQDRTERELFKPSGDPTCKTCKGMGYKGRRAISEALYFSREVRHMVVEADSKIDEDGIRELARSQGMLTLQDSAREVVKMGETSVEEMMRVTASED